MKKIIKCKQCHKTFIVKNDKVRNIKFCSQLCRNRSYQSRVNEWATKRRDEMAIPGENKIKCLVCKRWYKQVGSHVIQRHGFETARDYRIHYGLDRKSGLTTGDYRELKSRQVFVTGNIKNLNKGKKYWYVVNDPRAGRYVRSKQTMERLKKLYLLSKPKRKKN